MKYITIIGSVILIIFVLFLKSSNSYANEYKTIQITDNFCKIEIFDQDFNDKGDIVFVCWDVDSEIFLYESDTGNIIQLTDNLRLDSNPRLNNQGDVTWHGGRANNTQIFLYNHTTGVINQIGNGGRPEINDNSDIVWSLGDLVDNEIFLFDGQSGAISQLTDDDYSNRYPKINNRGDVVWEQVVETAEPEIHQIFLYKKATDSINQLTDNNFLNMHPIINDRADVVWTAWNRETDEYIITFYDGDSTEITELPGKRKNWEPAINNNGDVVWYAVDDLPVWSYHKILFYDRSTGSVTQLTNDRGNFSMPDINDFREVVWKGKDPLQSSLRNQIYFYDIDNDNLKLITHGAFGGMNTRINNDGDIMYLGVWAHYISNSGVQNDQPELFLVTKKKK